MNDEGVSMKIAIVDGGFIARQYAKELSTFPPVGPPGSRLPPEMAKIVSGGPDDSSTPVYGASRSTE